MSNNDKLFIKSVKNYLADNDMSAAGVARDLGVSRSTVSETLRGNYPYKGAWGCQQYIKRKFSFLQTRGG